MSGMTVGGGMSSGSARPKKVGLESAQLHGKHGTIGYSPMASIKLYNPQQAHKALTELWQHIKAALMAGKRLEVVVREETRSTEQNRRLWAMLNEVAAQVVWHGQKLSPEDWKHIFSASLKKQRAVPGIDGGFVVLGQSTSKMTVAEMSELQTLIEAFGAEQGVKFEAQE